MSFGCKLVEAIEAGFEVQRDEALVMAEKIISAGIDLGAAGSVHYWPSRFLGVDAKARDEAIREEFNGRNLNDVCNRHGVSARTVYRAVQRIPDPEETDKQQPENKSTSDKASTKPTAQKTAKSLKNGKT